MHTKKKDDADAGILRRDCCDTAVPLFLYFSVFFRSRSSRKNCFISSLFPQNSGLELHLMVELRHIQEI